MLKKWKKVIPRDNWTVTSSHHVCAKHFYDDFEFVSISLHKIGQKLVFSPAVQLKPTAVPRIFPSLPSYLTSPKCATRTLTATASHRRELENSRIEEQNAMLLEQDSVSDITSLWKKLADIMLPSNYVLVDKNSGILFLYISDYDVSCEPKVLSSVFVSDKLVVSAYVLSARVSHEMISHIINSKLTISSVTELTNLLAF